MSRELSDEMERLIKRNEERMKLVDKLIGIVVRVAWGYEPPARKANFELAFRAEAELLFMAAIDTENADLRQQLAEARAERDEAKNEIADLKTQRSYLVGQLDHKEREKDEFRKMIRMWQESVKRHRRNLDKVRDALGPQLQERDAQLAAQSAEIERLREELSLERAANVRWPIKRVEQTTPRNCGQACLAMVLDVPIDDVPKEASAEFWDANAVQEWLSGFGLQEIRVRCFDQSIWPANDVRCIVDGPSPRGEKMHAVVCTMQGPQGWVLDADPHPDNTGLADEPYSATFFAIKDPAAYIKELAELAMLRERLEAAEKMVDAGTTFWFRDVCIQRYERWPGEEGTAFYWKATRKTGTPHGVQVIKECSDAPSVLAEVIAAGWLPPASTHNEP